MDRHYRFRRSTITSKLRTGRIGGRIEFDTGMHCEGIVNSLKFDPKLSEAAFSVVFSNCENCRPEIGDDVILSDTAAKFGDSIKTVVELFDSLPAPPVFEHCCAVF